MHKFFNNILNTLQKFSKKSYEIPEELTENNNDNNIDVDEIKNIERTFMELYNKWNTRVMFMSTGNFNVEEYDELVNYSKQYPKICAICIKNILENEPCFAVHVLDAIFPDIVKIDGYVSLTQYCNIWLNILNGVSDVNKFKYYYEDYDTYMEYLNDNYIPWGGINGPDTDPNPTLKEFISNKEFYLNKKKVHE